MRYFTPRAEMVEKIDKPAVRRQPVYNLLHRTMIRNTPEKQKIKDRTMSFIHDYFLSLNVKRIRFMSLPGITWNFERELKHRLITLRGNRINVILIGCEIDYKVFSLSAAKMPGVKAHTPIQPYYSDKFGHYVVLNAKHQVYLLNIDIFELIDKPCKQKSDCIWLDTTNTVISIARKLENIDNILALKGVLILTVLKGREHVKFETDRVDYISKSLAKSGLKLFREESYFDTSPMLHLIYIKD